MNSPFFPENFLCFSVKIPRGFLYKQHNLCYNSHKGRTVCAHVPYETLLCKVFVLLLQRQ